MATKAERMLRKRELEEELKSVQAQKAAVGERKAVLEKAARDAQAAREAAAAAAAEARAKAQAQAAQAAAAAAQKARERAAREKAARENGHKESKKRAAPEPPALPKPVQLSPEMLYNQKKQRIEADRQRRLSSIWSQCGTMLKALKKISHSWPFQVPVDDVKLNIPDYYKIIKNPMDLGTVEKKLAHNPAKGQNREYKHPLEFRDDIRLIWENCRAYNRPGQLVRKAGDKMSDTFEKKWAAADIEKKLKEEKKYRGREDLELAELEANLTGTQQAKAYAAKMRKLNAELITELEESKADGKAQGADKNAGMSFEQKRRLSVALSSLPGDKLNRVLEIVSESNAASVAEDGDEEVELDIDTLDQATLQELQKYVDSIIPAHSVPSKLPTKSTNTGAAKAPAPKEQPAASGEKVGRETAGGKAPQADPQGEKGKSDSKGEGVGAKPSDSDSSSSSSDGSSSSSGSDSADGAEHHGSTFNAGDGATGGGAGASDQGGPGQGGDGMEASALVSVTRPAGPAHNSILKSASSKKEVTIQNAGAWASLTQARGGDGDGEPNGKDKGEDGKGDELWSEFTAREEQQRKREQERKDEEEMLAKEKKEKEEEEKARVERVKAQAAEKEEKKRKEAEDEEEESRRVREAERAKELAKLSDMGKATDLGIGGGDGEEMMKPTTGGNAGLAMLGLKMKDNDDNDDDDEMEETYNSEAEDMEDGEV